MKKLTINKNKHQIIKIVNHFNPVFDDDEENIINIPKKIIQQPKVVKKPTPNFNFMNEDTDKDIFGVFGKQGKNK